MKLPVVQLPDIQANQPDIAITLTRVGVTDVKKLVEVARKISVLSCLYLRLIFL